MAFSPAYLLFLYLGCLCSSSFLPSFSKSLPPPVSLFSILSITISSGPVTCPHSSSLPFHLLSSLAISLFISLFSIYLGYLSIWIHPGRDVYLVLQKTPSLFPPLIPLIYLAIRSYLFRLPIYSVVLSQSSLISLAPSALSVSVLSLRLTALKNLYIRCISQYFIFPKTAAKVCLLTCFY